MRPKLIDGACTEQTGATPREVIAAYREVSRDEAAAVAAFERLAVELALVDAPLELVERAREAAREEVEHAAMFASAAAAADGAQSFPSTIQVPL